MNNKKPFSVRLEHKRNCEFFLKLSIPQQCADDCEHLLIIPDMYDTGDSPTGYDCDAVTRKDCPLWCGDQIT